MLGEISSSVDHETDERIKEIIKAKPEKYTLITVLNKLQTVVRCSDRVNVLDGGRTVEPAAARELLATPET